MGAGKSQQSWVYPPGYAPPGANAAMNPNAGWTNEHYDGQDLIYNKGGQIVYPRARAPEYTPMHDPYAVGNAPIVYNASGKPVKSASIPTGYIPPGANHPAIPKKCQLVNGPRGPTVLTPSDKVARKLDVEDGLPNGTWFGYPLAVGVMLDAGFTGPPAEVVPAPYNPGY